MTHCHYCGQTAEAIGEYQELAEQDGYSSVEEYVKHQEGTYNADEDIFCCTSCYLNLGCPSNPFPETNWKAGDPT